MENFEFKKSLGQNFLIDQNIINKIVASIDLKPDSLIIEVGPGSGALTKQLVKLDSNVICFEIDNRLKSELDILEKDNKNLKIYYQDFLNSNLKEVLLNYQYKNLYVIANIPYYITTAIINKIHEETNVFEMILMVQKEVGDRFMSPPNNKSYNSLSVFLQYNYDISKVVLVNKNCFMPKPKVDSIVIKFKTKAKKFQLKNEEKFYKLIKDSFTFKRKNLKNNLKQYDLENIEKILKKFNKDLTCRAESLTVEEFVSISNELS